MKYSFIIVIALLFIPNFMSAHPGNTASDGMHYCWTNCAYWGEVYGARHSHGGYTPSYNYSPPTYSTYSSCPSNSYSVGSSCKCNYGYVASGGACVSGNSICHTQLGIMSSYDSLSNTCKCDYGYVIGSSGECEYKSTYTPTYVPSFDYSLYSPTYSCPAHSSESLTDSSKCTCDVGYQVNSSKTKCTKISAKTNDKLCRADFGSKSKWNGEYDDDGSPYCICKNGYQWDSTETSCVTKSEKNNTETTTNNTETKTQLPAMSIKGYVKSVGDSTLLKCDGMGWINQNDVNSCLFYRQNKNQYNWTVQ